MGPARASSASRGCIGVLKVFGQPKPAGPPPGYPERGWPLWFVGYAFIHTRRAGGLLTLGLLLNVLAAGDAALAVTPEMRSRAPKE